MSSDHHVKMMALMVASFEGKLDTNRPSLNDESKLKILRELSLIMDNLPNGVLDRPDTFPALGYIFNAMLKIISSGVTAYQPIIKDEAATILKCLVKRQNSDEFINTVAPGTFTVLLKMLTGWERETASLIIKVIQLVNIFLLRGLERTIKDEKLEIIQNRLCAIALTLKRTLNEQIRTCYQNLLLSLQDNSHFQEENRKRLILKALAIIVNDLQSACRVRERLLSGSLLATACLMLTEEVDDLLVEMDRKSDFNFKFSNIPATTTGALIESCDRIKGLMLILSKDLWPCTRQLFDRILFFADSIQSALVQALSNGHNDKLLNNIDTDKFGWSNSLLGQSLAEILVLMGQEGMAKFPDLFSAAIPSISKLLCLAQLSEGLATLQEVTEVLEYLLNCFDEYSNSDPSSNSDVAIETETAFEQAWMVSWCSALMGCMRNEEFFESRDTNGKEGSFKYKREAFDFAYTLRPLLVMLGSKNIILEETAKSVLLKICQITGLVDKADLANDNKEKRGGEGEGEKSVKLLISNNATRLLELVSLDLRFPALFPKAPVQLFILTVLADNVLSSQRLLAVIRDIEDFAASYQNYPAYIRSILDCLASCLDNIVKAKYTKYPCTKHDLMVDKDVNIITNDDCKEREEKEKEKEKEKEEEESVIVPELSLEQELSSSIIRIAINFVASDEDSIRFASLNVLQASIQPFKRDNDESSKNAFLPLVHLCWPTLLDRIGDTNLNVVMSTLRTISLQAQVAGDFMKDRVQKELLDKIGYIPLEKESIALIIEILYNVGGVSKRLLRSLVYRVIGLAEKAIITIETAVNLICALAEIDQDQVWYILIVQYGELLTLSHKTCPLIDLKPFKEQINSNQYNNNSKFNTTTTTTTTTATQTSNLIMTIVAECTQRLQFLV